MKLLAHATKEPHTEDGTAGGLKDVAEINALYLIGAAAVIAVIGLIVWKFLLKK